MATPSTVEGEATALFLAESLRGLGVRATRIASGIPHGGDLEYADPITLGRALEGRRSIVSMAILARRICSVRPLQAQSRGSTKGGATTGVIAGASLRTPAPPSFPSGFAGTPRPLFGTWRFFVASASRAKSRCGDRQSSAAAPGAWRPATLVAARRAAHRVYTHRSRYCLTDALLRCPETPDRTVRTASTSISTISSSHGRGAAASSWSPPTPWQLASEVGGRLLKLSQDIRTTMVMAAETNAGTRPYVDDLRRRSGVDVVYASGNDPGTALTLLTRLRANEVVAIQVDRPPPSATVIETRIFGARWPVPEGPFRLAQASGAPIVPVFLRRSGYRKYTFHLERPIDGGSSPAASRRER